MTEELNIEGPWVSPVRADEVRFWETVRSGASVHPHDFHPDFVSSVVEVCEGCKVFGLRTKRRAFYDLLWSTIPVLRVYNNGRVRLEMEAFCPVCWTKLVWVMVHKHKPFFFQRRHRRRHCVVVIRHWRTPMKDNTLKRKFVCGGMIAIITAEVGSGLSKVTFEGPRTLPVPVAHANVFRQFTADITESTEQLAWMSKLLPAMTDDLQDEGALAIVSGVPVGLVRQMARELQKLNLVESQEMPNTFLWRRGQ